MNTACACFSSLAKASTDSATAEGVRFRSTMIFASKPAADRALAVSYSQLVPGKAGIRTLGLAKCSVVRTRV